ncbi:MAG: TRAP transporter small permease subunit, partial [Leptospirales bacterium]
PESPTDMLKKLSLQYVQIVDRFSTRIGIFAMFIVLALIGILLYESTSRTFFDTPNVWSLELAQFAMAAYYLLGGAYALKYNGHARMDLFYHTWSARKKALSDMIMFLVTLTYLSVMLYGAVDNTLYAIEYDQKSYSAWKPSLIPIKLIMTFGIFLMFLQSISELIKDVLIYQGHPPADFGRPAELRADAPGEGA